MKAQNAHCSVRFAYPQQVRTNECIRIRALMMSLILIHLWYKGCVDIGAVLWTIP